MSNPTALVPVKEVFAPPPPPAPPVFATTSNAKANAVLTSLDNTIKPFREAPPAQQGQAGVVAGVIGGALGVINAPATFIDNAVDVGVNKLLEVTGLKALFPPAPVARLGITMHIGTPHSHPHPPSFGMPLPSLGVAFLAGSASVLVNGLPALRAGDVGLGLTCGTFAPPFEIITGASGVYFGGSRVARIGMDLTRHCNPAEPMGAFALGMGLAGLVAGAAGVAAQVEAGNPVAAAVQAQQAALDAAALALSLLCGKDPAAPPGIGMLVGPPPNVVAGGPPIPNIGAWAKGHLFKAVGKAARALKTKVQRRFPSKDANAGVCKTLEPVHFVTGENYNTHVDFKAFHGAFTWARYTTSARAHVSGPVGYGFFHVFQARLHVRLHRVTYFGFDGERIEFPRFLPNQMEMVTQGYRLIRFSDTHFLLEERRLGKMEFRRASPLVNEAVPTAVETKAARATLHYNQAGQLEQIREARYDGAPASAQYQLYYDSNGRLIEIQGCNLECPEGVQPTWMRLVSYAYDAAGDLRVAEDAVGLQERYQYDRLHRLIEATDRRDYSYRWQYDLEGRCIGGGGQDGAWRATLRYFPEERKTELTDHDGSVRVAHYDEDGVITKIVDAYGGELVRLRNDDGSIAAEIDAGGREVTHLHDSQGAHIGRRDRFGFFHLPQLEEPMLCNRVDWDLPDTPRERAIGELPGELSPAFSPEAIWARGPRELRTTLRAMFQEPAAVVATPQRQYDTYGRVLRETHADGSSEEWQYDGVGNCVMHLDREGRLSQWRITSWNLIGASIDPLGSAVSYTYNPHEHITSITDPLGNESRYDYDSKDRLIRVQRNGRVREEYSYDVGDRLIEKRGHDGRPLLKFKPHKNGLFQSIELACGGSIELDYDERGCPTKASTDRYEVVQHWNEQRRLVRATCDGRSVEHGYGTLGRTSTTVAKRFKLSYQRVTGRRGQRLEAFALTICAPNGFKWTLEHGADGVVQLQHGEASTATHELQQYNAQGKLSARAVYQIQPASPNSPLAAWCSSYRYSLEGDLLEIRDTQRGRRMFEVDAAHRLVAELALGGRRIEYPLDEAGNLLSKPGLLLAKVTTGNRLLYADVEAFTYDERDHIVERVRGIDRLDAPRVRYERDSFDQLVAVRDAKPEPWTASYDGLGRRISAGRGDRQTTFWWDDDRLAAETFPGGVLRIYVYAHDRALVPIGFVDYDNVEAEPESGRAYSVYSDQVGLPLCIADSEGKVVWWAEHVDPYGAVHVRAGAAVEYNLRWPGHYFDAETGLHYNRFRYYDPRLGRYLESDPLGCAGGVNLYAYTPNPLVSVDVLGLHNEEVDPPKDKGKNKPAQEETEAAPKPTNPPQLKPAKFTTKEEGAVPSAIDPAKLTTARQRQAESVQVKKDKQVRGVVATDGSATRENGVNTRDSPHSKVGREDPADTTQTAKDVGHPLPGSGRDVQRTSSGDYVGGKNAEPGNTPMPGSQAANHSEKQVAHDQRQNERNEPIGVSDEQCGDCRKFHRSEAVDRGEQTVVADPNHTRVYNPDGSVDIYDTNNNYVGTAPPGTPPTGGTSGYKGGNPW